MAAAFQTPGFQRSAFQNVSNLITASAENLTYPVNCVMEILKGNRPVTDVRLSKALFKHIFNE